MAENNDWMLESAVEMFKLLTRVQDFLLFEGTDEIKNRLLDDVVIERNKWWEWQKQEILNGRGAILQNCYPCFDRSKVLWGDKGC